MSDRQSAGERLLSTLGVRGDVGLVRVEDHFPTDIDDLWSALTDPARLARWYGEVSGDLHVGGSITVHVATAGIDAAGRVNSCEPPHHLNVTVRETDESAGDGVGVPPFDELIDATLTPDDDGTVLVLEIQGMPRDKVAAYGAGWQLHAEALGAFLAGHEQGDDVPRWTALIPLYEEMAAELQ